MARDTGKRLRKVCVFHKRLQIRWEHGCGVARYLSPLNFKVKRGRGWGL